MSKKVLIISNYWHFPEEKSSSRYNSIAEKAVEAGLNIEVITSTFYHTKKIQRVVTPKSNYKATLVREPSYNKNVTVKRIISHITFANGVIKYLKENEKPDVIYVFTPPTILAKKVVKYANINNIKVIIDVLDLWPEAFEMLLPKFALKLLFPMRKSVEYAYKNADEVVAVSKTYINKVNKFNKRGSKGVSVYIGTDLSVFDEYANGAQELTGKLRPITMAYIGMLGHSYDLILVMDAMKSLINQGYDNVEFLVMGSGPMQEKFENYARENNLPVRFTGRLSYKDMVQNLVMCDFGINALIGSSVASIINKHADYVSAGIPMINIQKDNEFNNLLKEYDAGIVCDVGNVTALEDAIRFLADNQDERIRMGKNGRKLAEELFDRNYTYKNIIDLIEK